MAIYLCRIATSFLFVSCGSDTDSTNGIGYWTRRGRCRHALALRFDVTGLSEGAYVTTLMAFGLPLVRDSPQEIPITLTVRPPQAP